MRIVRAAVMMCVLAPMTAGWARSQTQPSGAPPETPGQAPGKELPDAPGESKKESTGAVQAVEDRTKQAATMTRDVAAEGLIRARDWESTWISGVYVGKNQPLITPTRKQREEYYLRQTLTTPGAYLKRMFGAGIDQAEGAPRQWDDGWGGYAERFASREGQFITANTLAALGNAKLGYEIRYDKCKCKGALPRTKRAILRNFLTYDRSEVNLRPQWGLYGGAFGGGVVATTWKPGAQTYWKNGVWGIVGQAGYGALLNFFTEFSTEINRKQGVR